MQVDPPPAQPLQPLPVPLLLLTLAIAARQQAAALEPQLAVRPDPAKPDELDRYGQAWRRYVQHQHNAVGYLTDLIEVGAGSMTGGQRIILRARGLLVEWLSQDPGGTQVGMAEAQIGKALSMTQSHASFFQFQLYFLSHQARLSTITQPPNLRSARATLKRALALLDSAAPPPLPPSATPSCSSPHLTDPAGFYPHWRYHLLIQIASVATPDAGPTDFPAALAAWRDVASLATRRGDGQLVALAKLSLARLELERGSHTAGHAVLELGALLGYAAADLAPKGETPEDKAAREAAARARVDRSRPLLPGSELRVQGALIYCLWCVEEGRVTEAKVRLREMHKLLDDVPDQADKPIRLTEEAGFVQLPIHPYMGQSASTHQAVSTPNPTLDPTPTSVTVLVSPRGLVYKFAFLASLGVYRDPFGSKPKSVLFGKQGIDMIDSALQAGKNKLPPQIAPHQIPAHLSALAAIRLSLLTYSAEISLLRSDFVACLSTLDELIATARKHDVWETVAPRVCLIRGMLHQAQGEDQPAYDTLAAVEAGRTGEDEGAQLGARLALLVLSMSKGIAIRLDSTRAGARWAGGGMEQDELARRFVEEAARGPPSWRLAGEFVMAMTRGEITKSKHHLSEALNLANAIGANHAKALLLALLGNLYLHTRNDEAQKMLTAAFSIAQGLGARLDNRGAEQRAADKAAGRLGDDVVGATRVGLWCGEQLLERYKMHGDIPKARAQWAINEAHRRVIDKEARARVTVAATATSV